MILRIKKRRIDTKTKNEWNTDNFFDNFDHVNVEDVNIKEEKFSCGCVTSAFTTEETKYCKKLSLLKNDNISTRIIYVDASYDIYLMSDEGKTIERL